MVKSCLKNFKAKFPELVPQVDSSLVKTYAKDNFYNSQEPIYGVGAESQMEALIVEAEKMGLDNFRSIAPLSKNQGIKESFESILFNIKTNNLDPTLFKDRIFICGEGTLTNLQNILLDIYGLNSFSGIISRFKKEMLEGFAMEILNGAKAQNNEVILQKFKPRGEEWHIHDISTILNVLSSEWNINRKSKSEDKYIGNIDNIFEIKRIKDYIDQRVQDILENHEYLSEAILAKLEIGLPEFDYLRSYDTQYIKNFSNKLDEWIELKSSDFQFLNQYTNLNELFCAEVLKLGTENIELFGYKGNYKEILRNFIVLFLSNDGVVQLNDEQRYIIINKLLVDCGLPVNEEIIPEYLLKYAIDNDRVIINKKYQVIDPVKMYLHDGRKQYALDHIKRNCEKYGSNMTKILSILNDAMESGGETYSEIVTQLKYQKQYFGILCNAIRYKQDELIYELFDSVRKEGVVEELLGMRDKVGSIFDYARKSKNDWLINEILDIAIQDVSLFDNITDQDISKINLYKHPEFLKIIENYFNVKQEIIEDIKNEINPAKWSYLMPDFVSSFTKKFSYTEERDVLVLKIVDTYIKSKHYSLKEILEKKEDIKIDLREIVRDKKDEIINFLNQGENYDVGRSTINDILNEKKFDNKTFAEKIIAKNNSRHSLSI